MRLDFQSETPIFLQIAEEIESAIISGAYEEDAQIPSTTEISVSHKINPATVLKGITILVSDGIIYKKRGLGMFVAAGAKQKIIGKRRKAFSDKYVMPLISEAKKLSMDIGDIEELIKRGF